MGTHPNAPSLVKSQSNKKLYDLIQEEPSKYLGDSVYNHFGKDLPFLFKVLSVGKALSIQAHPDKQLGSKLHAERPNVYKDPNHKPEMTIALTEFEALCGFRPVEQISKFLEEVPEFGELVGEEVKSFFIQNSGSDSKSSLQKLFEKVMTSDDQTVKTLLDKLIGRLQSNPLKDSQLNELVSRVHNQYPGDVGVWCVFLLNYVILTPGDALFLCANEPHAYLSGGKL
jgi:mannose-6-phosphate isomerase